MSYKIVVPVLNGGELWKLCIESILAQEIDPSNVIVIDSGSSDDSCRLSADAGFMVHKIPVGEFNHGGTRNLGVELAGNIDFVVFLTQDAILKDKDAVSTLLKSFDDETVAASFGRQIPHANAGPIGAHARLFNYPDKSLIKSMKDVSKLGLKTIFISNSFSAYRVSALKEVSGFPLDTIFGEDTYTAGKLIINGFNVAYCANTKVYHSHDYSFSQEFKRYFDIGVFHSREKWMRETFGKAEGEGKRFVISEIKYITKTSPHLLFSVFFRTIIKFLGYKIGQKEKFISAKIKSLMSMNRRYWE